MMVIRKLTMLMMALAVALPSMAQEVEVASRQRLLEDVEGPAYYPVLNQAGDRLLFLSENGSLKFHDLIDNVTATVATTMLPAMTHAGAATARYISSHNKSKRTT